MAGITAAAIIICAAALAAAQAPTPASTFRSGINLVALTVTVERADGSYVSSLRSDDFRVFEAGVEQDVAFFGAGEVPIDLILMLDTSASMFGRLHVAQRAAINFISALRPADRAVLMTFGVRAETVVPFTADHLPLTRAIQGLHAGGTTALYNAVYASLQEFGRATPGADLRRRAIVVLSDGDDTTSLVSFESLIEQVRSVGVAIYAIALQPHRRDDRPLGSARYEMQQLARETGGRSFFPEALEDLEGVYTSIARELAHQYAIGYVPAAASRRNEFRRVAVRVQHPNMTVRTRSGYIIGD